MKSRSATRNVWLTCPCGAFNHFSGWFTGSRSRIGSSFDSTSGVIGSRSAGSLGKKCSLCSASSRFSSLIGSGASYADVDEPIVAAKITAVLPHDEQRRRLHPPLVAAAGLPGLERRHQAIRQRSGRMLERLREVLHRLVGHRGVRLGGVAVSGNELTLAAGDAARRAVGAADSPARPVERRRAAEAGGVAARVHHAHLPILQGLIGPRENAEGLFG